MGVLLEKDFVLAVEKNPEADCIRSLKSQVSDNIEQTYDEAAKAITSFTPPAEKFLHGLGIFLGITAALAVAVATGGFLFILLSMAGAPLWLPISISALMFMASSVLIFGFFLFIVLNFCALWLKVAESLSLSTKRVIVLNYQCSEKAYFYSVLLFQLPSA